ncbi:MAG: (Fe-S)-binding protein, partial [Mobilicoccus sp.]|nr:(Fe-S)-binding protein [Mobilicoccus sp.]
MSALQIMAIVISLVITTVGWLLLFRAVFRLTTFFRSGAPDPRRTSEPGARTAALLREFLGHTRMSRLPVVAIAHWFTAVGFLVLSATLATAHGQVFNPYFHLPIIGGFPPFEWVIEILAWATLIGIIALVVVRQRAHPRVAAGEKGRRSRFFGSTWWEAYFVEAIIFGVSLCILILRTQEAALARMTQTDPNLWLQFPLTGWLAGLWTWLPLSSVEGAVVFVALVKILISYTWMIVVSTRTTMGVAWHRFLAFPNIWFKRHPNRTSLGELQPMYSGGQAITAENLEEVMEAAEEAAGEEDAEHALSMGVGTSRDFTWKQLLDFSTCTECGRCQSQCPAWNTDKPLSPKLLMMTLRDHSQELAPWMRAASDSTEGVSERQRELATVPLVGATGYEEGNPLSAYTPHGPDAVIDADVLWSCTTCGACVEQCPVDIEHVDAIVDMRRHQVLIESAFPAEFGGLFKNMESKGNPWGMAPKMRLDWAKGLDFEVPIVGADVEDLSSVDYLFWVGCAGAFEDRAKKTTRAVAELLHEADVSFAVLGEGETCTGDSARRAGNEILFQMLAAQNVEVLNESGAKKIIVTCAHCFNTLKNEYPQNGGHYEVLHHTQLLNRLVREKRLVPVARPQEHPGLSSAKKVQSTAPTVTYHDPCYLGRHNDVYAPPRELIGALPGVELREMPRHGMKSFCCGAGGARMWAEENLGTRVNLNRTAEAVETGADRIAIGCPFCRVMMTDGLTAMQSDGTAREEVEVVDVAQMLLAAVRRGEAPDESAELGEDHAGHRGAADAPPPEQDAKAAREEADEAGGPEFETSGRTEQAAQEARQQEPAPQEAPAAEAAPDQAKPKGKMSAADALAAMQAQSGSAPAAEEAAPAPAAEQAPASADSAPQAAEKPAEMPKGKMSAADALAAMQAKSAAPAAQESADATAPAADQASAGAAPQAEAPAADAPSVAQAAPAKPAEMPKGKMSAADALAMMKGAAAAAPADAPAAPAESAAPAEPAAPEQPKEATAPAEPEAATAPAAEAPQEASPAAAEDRPQEAAPSAATSAQESPSAAQPQAAQLARPAAKVEMPKGRMSASEALAMMGSAAPAAPAEPAPAESAPA